MWLKQMNGFGVIGVNYSTYLLISDWNGLKDVADIFGLRTCGKCVRMQTGFPSRAKDLCVYNRDHMSQHQIPEGSTD